MQSPEGPGAPSSPHSPGAQAPGADGPSWPELLEQAAWHDAVSDAFFKPRGEALPLLDEAYDRVMALAEAKVGPPGAQTLYLLARRMRFFGGRPQALQRALDRAERWARQHDDSVLMVCVLCERGNMDDSVGLGRSLAYYSEALRLAGRLMTRQAECYAWSELAWRPRDWLRLGLAAQRTRVPDNGRNLQRGVFAQLKGKHISGAVYWFNPAADDQIAVVSVALSF